VYQITQHSDEGIIATVIFNDTIRSYFNSENGISERKVNISDVGTVEVYYNFIL
jgi:hypothetical protein